MKSEPPAEAKGLPSLLSDLRSLSQRERVLHFDAEVPHRGLDFGVAEQNLNSPQVPGLLVNYRCLGASERMRPIILTPQTDRRHPLVDEPGVLACAEVALTLSAAGECKLVDGTAPPLQPG